MMKVFDSADGERALPTAGTADETNDAPKHSETEAEAQQNPSLRSIIQMAADEEGLSLGDLTVMSNKTDPYRIDTPANHVLGRWVKDALDLTGAQVPIHPRGLHYAIISVDPPILKPNGEPYRNNDDDWTYLETCTNCARWLRYIPFEAILDERNAPPIIETQHADLGPELYVAAGQDSLDVPAFNDLYPSPMLENFTARQAYRLVMMGEKSSLASVLRSIAQNYHSELILPTGEMSNALLHGMLMRGVKDGRPVRAFYFSDLDPTGYTMPLNVARKIQGLIHLYDLDIDIQLRRCALTIDQVRELGLPSTPLKETEKRADRWRERFGVEQTEIDALATLRPDVLHDIAVKALDPYFDHDLEYWIQEKKRQIAIQANARLNEAIEAHDLAAIRKRYEKAMAAAKKAIAEAAPILEEIIDETAEALEDIDITPPRPVPEGDVDEPLYSSSDDFVTATLKLRGEKL